MNDRNGGWLFPKPGTQEVQEAMISMEERDAEGQQGSVYATGPVSRDGVQAPILPYTEPLTQQRSVTA